MLNNLDTYRAELAGALRSINPEIVTHVAELLYTRHKDGGLIFTVGNGGSAATASHVANDLTKACGLSTICVSDMTPTTLAYMNDDGVDVMFSKLLEKTMGTNDTLLAFSCSGESLNIIKALDVSFLAVAIGFTGYDIGGNSLTKLTDYVFRVPSMLIEVQEDVHLIICHMIVTLIKEMRRQERDA